MSGRPTLRDFKSSKGYRLTSRVRIHLSAQVCHFIPWWTCAECKALDSWIYPGDDGYIYEDGEFGSLYDRLAAPIELTPEDEDRLGRVLRPGEED